MSEHQIFKSILLRAINLDFKVIQIEEAYVIHAKIKLVRNLKAF